MNPFIKKRIGDDYLVWYENSNRWVYFEEPAWFVIKMFHKGIDKKAIILRCKKKYQLSIQECEKFVEEIVNSLTEYNLTPELNRSIVQAQAISLQNNTLNNFAKRVYLIGHKHICITYGSRLAEYYVHPPLAYLETHSFPAKEDGCFEVYYNENSHVLKDKLHPENDYIYTDFNDLKKQLFIYIANVLHNKTSNDWLSIIHASAVTNGEKAILLSSPSGSGKSTMAALLQAEGLQIISDDFVPIDTKSKKAYPFPAAISVKEDAYSFLSTYYQKYKTDQFEFREYPRSKIRYLSPKISGIELQPKSVSHLVFIRYNPEVSCNLTPITTVEAFRLFHTQARVSANSSHARGFLNWFLKLKVYNLEYGDTQKGIKSIISLS